MEYARYRNGKRIYSIGRIIEYGAKYYGIFEKHKDKPMWRRSFFDVATATAEEAQIMLDDIADDAGWLWCDSKSGVKTMRQKPITPIQEVF